MSQQIIKQSPVVDLKKVIRRKRTLRWDAIVMMMAWSLLFVFQTLTQAGFVASIPLIQTIPFITLVVLGINRGSVYFRTHKVPRWFQLWLAVYALDCALMLGLTLVSGTTPRMLYLNALPFVLVGLMFFGTDDREWTFYTRLMMVHCLIGTAMVAMNIFDFQVAKTTSSDRNVRTFVLSETHIASSGYLLYAVVYLVGGFFMQSIKGRIVGLIGLVCFAFVGILAQYRQMLIGPFLMIVFAFFAGYRSGASKRTLAIFGGSALAIMIALSVAVSTRVSTGNLILDRIIENFDQRFEAGDEDSGFTLRLREAEMAAETFTIFDYAVGRGIAGSWDGGTIYDEERYMLHFGPAHLVMKGGVILLVVFVAFPFVRAWKVLLTSRNPKTLACAVVICVWSMQWVWYDFPQANLTYVLYMLCLGRLILVEEADAPKAAISAPKVG